MQRMGWERDWKGWERVRGAWRRREVRVRGMRRVGRYMVDGRGKGTIGT